MSDQNSFVEEIKRSMKSEDHPLGKRIPGAPFALVALTYFAVLFLGAMVLWAVIG